MSQEQPQKENHEEEGIKYGDVFNVKGEMKSKPEAPVDAGMMQKAETETTGKTQKAGAAMQSAAAKNERGWMIYTHIYMISCLYVHGACSDDTWRMLERNTVDLPATLGVKLIGTCFCVAQ